MKNDVNTFCWACLVFPSRKVTRTTFRPPLALMPVGDREAVDILQLPLTAQGNCYVVIFMDYLTKWPEAFAIPGQKAEIIANLFVEQIVCHHGGYLKSCCPTWNQFPLQCKSSYQPG